MEWTQVITSLAAAGVTFASMAVVYRNIGNSLYLDSAAKQMLNDLKAALKAEQERREELDRAIETEKKERDLDKRDIANLNIRLDQRDAEVKALRLTVDDLKKQMQSVTHDYRVQVEHWQQRALAAEAQIEQSKGRKL